HGHSAGQHRHREEALYLAGSQLLDGGILRRPLHSTVPAPIVVRPVAVVLAVRLVVLGVVGHEIVEGEAVMTRHEVDALLGLALLVSVERRAADQAIGKALDRALLAAEKAPRIIAEPPVPLPPAIPAEAPHLVQAGRVP